ncbi:MAG: hypothetical protein P4L85_19520 [Paludisphaera borealis]|uniref:hypothetical protein n=1 Tax=Paludisphaera borealis TaxID=1387353 RepID=UPI00284B1234|nr:hypothetical protein [Paludisphaera borealis]MDR3621550.1 hypothetical protein [Paludisphaera borealis]
MASNPGDFGRCCGRCGALILDGSSTLKPEMGELRRHLRRGVVVLCVGCSEGFLDWLREPQELPTILSPVPTFAPS